MQEDNPVPDIAVHRLGGGSLDNLRLKPKEMTLARPGISVFLGGSPDEAVEQVRDAFPNATRLLEEASTVGTATVAAIRQAGFDVIPDPTRRFPNHARLVHSEGISGFREANLRQLVRAFTNISRC